MYNYCLLRIYCSLHEVTIYWQQNILGKEVGVMMAWGTKGRGCLTTQVGGSQRQETMTWGLRSIKRCDGRLGSLGWGRCGRGSMGLNHWRRHGLGLAYYVSDFELRVERVWKNAKHKCLPCLKTHNMVGPWISPWTCGLNPWSPHISRTGPNFSYGHADFFKIGLLSTSSVWELGFVYSPLHAMNN